MKNKQLSQINNEFLKKIYDLILRELDKDIINFEYLNELKRYLISAENDDEILKKIVYKLNNCVSDKIIDSGLLQEIRQREKNLNIARIVIKKNSSDAFRLRMKALLKKKPLLNFHIQESENEFIIYTDIQSSKLIKYTDVFFNQ